jgi:hypothetical protein
MVSVYFHQTKNSLFGLHLFLTYKFKFYCIYFRWVITYKKLTLLNIRVYGRNAFMLFIVINQVRDIPCGTKGGVMISFDKIEV